MNLYNARFISAVLTAFLSFSAEASSCKIPKLSLQCFDQSGMHLLSDKGCAAKCSDQFPDVTPVCEEAQLDTKRGCEIAASACWCSTAGG